MQASCQPYCDGPWLKTTIPNDIIQNLVPSAGYVLIIYLFNIQSILLFFLDKFYAQWDPSINMLDSNPWPTCRYMRT